MKMHVRFGGLIALLVWGLTQTMAAQSVEPQLPRSDKVVRTKPVDLTAQSVQSLKPHDHVTLDLFEDTVLAVDVQEAWKSDGDTHHVMGRVQGNPHSTVLLVSHRGAVAGKMHVPSVGDFAIRTLADGGQVVEEIELAAFPPCGCGNPLGGDHALMRRGPEGLGGLNRAVPPANDATEGTACQANNLIDLMVVYTPEAQSQQGGNAAIEARIVLAVDEVNLIYSNSAITPRIRLVHMGEIDYAETGDFLTELLNLTENGEGFMDDVHTRRDQFGADVVSLIISHDQDNTICGIGWLMTPPDPAFQDRAFNVNNADCTFMSMTLPHEIGHNQGCDHDRDNAGLGGGSYPFSYGHRFNGTDGIEYRTVMSYAPGSRIPHFSNPGILYQGAATGLPELDPLAADNARTINQTAPTVSAFRTGQPVTVYPPPVLVEAPLQLEPDDRLGVSVAIAGDLALVGAYTDDGLNNSLPNAGCAYVYRYDSVLLAWVLERRLQATDASANDRFGVSVDLLPATETQGAVAIIGAYLDDAPAANSGSAYIFRRNATGTWTQETKIVAPDGLSNDVFGFAVAMTRKGTVEHAIVGAYLVNMPLINDCGAAYAYSNTGSGVWNFHSKLLAPEADRQAGDNFGFSVAVDADNIDDELIAVIGAWKDDGAVMEPIEGGAAYVFHHVNSAWTFDERLVSDTRAPGDEVGYAVAVDARSGTDLIAVSSWKEDGAFANTGAAYVFDNAFKGWAQRAKLLPSGAALNDQFGVSIALEGDFIVVGDSRDDGVTFLNTGSAQAFRNIGGGWTFESKLTDPAARENDEFGFDVDLSDGRMIISAWEADHEVKQGTLLVDRGAVFISGASVPVDCNANGIDDLCDIASGTSLDANGNGVPDECDPPVETCPGDIADPPDGLVDVNDLLLIINSWGQVGGPADIDGDNFVGVNDLLAVINAWGVCPAP